MPGAFLSRRLAARLLAFFFFSCAAAVASAARDLPPEAAAGLEKLYAGDPGAAIEYFQTIQQSLPDHPLGYFLEAEALWWKIYCSSLEFKYGLTDAWRRPKLREDQRYFELAQKAVITASALASISFALARSIRSSPMPILAWVFTTTTWTRSRPSPGSYASLWAYPAAARKTASSSSSAP